MNIWTKIAMEACVVGLGAGVAAYHATPARDDAVGLLMLAQQPRPSNPTPQPSNPMPRPVNPTPPPATNTPAVQPTPANQPGTVTPPANQPATTTQPAVGLRYARPFAFTSPEVEARFNESGKRLMALETRLNKSNQDLLKRLGEIRRLPPERQNAATFELLQQMLMDQQQMNQYLVAARTAWSGEFEGATDMGTPAAGQPQPGQQAQPVTPRE